VPNIPVDLFIVNIRQTISKITRIKFERVPILAPPPTKERHEEGNDNTVR
jgi:hypothetical protein